MDLSPIPNWDDAYTESICVKESHIDFDIAVANIATQIQKAMSASIGDIPAIVDLLKSMTLSIYVSKKSAHDNISRNIVGYMLGVGGYVAPGGVGTSLGCLTMGLYGKPGA